MGKHDNLPPGVNVGMLPGNTPEDAAWEKFCEWAYDNLADSGLTVGECYMAVRSGIASIKAIQDDIRNLIKEAYQEAKLDLAYNQVSKEEEKERKRREQFERESG